MDEADRDWTCRSCRWWVPKASLPGQLGECRFSASIPSSHQDTGPWAITSQDDWCRYWQDAAEPNTEVLAIGQPGA